jgi:hypothetical protein
MDEALRTIVSLLPFLLAALILIHEDHRLTSPNTQRKG